jgi:hypothetical protein
MITAIATVTLDRQEYSRYYRNVSTLAGDMGLIVAQVAASGQVGDDLHCWIVQRRTGRVVARKAVDLAGAVTEVTFDLDLDCNDADGIYRATHGQYVLVASSLPLDDTTGGGIALASAPFVVTPASVTELKEIWLPSTSLTLGSTIEPTVQGLAGAVGVGARDVQRGGYPLTWNATARTLAWGDTEYAGYGPAVVVPSSGPAYTVDLWNRTIDQTMTLALTPADLPGVDTLGYVMCDFPDLKDEMMRRHLDTALAEMARIAHVPLEPRLVCTRALRDSYPLAEKKDATGVTYRASSRGVRFSSGFRRVLAVHEVAGYANRDRVTQYGPEWVNWDDYTGEIFLQPGMSITMPTAVAGRPFGGGFAAGSAGGPIQQYWQFALTHGLADLYDEAPAVARQGILRYAAIMVLLQAGHATVGVVTSSDFGRDGTNYSNAYAGGQWGVYSDMIGEHVRWFDNNVGPEGRKLRHQLVGVEVS